MSLKRGAKIRNAFVESSTELEQQTSTELFHLGRAETTEIEALVERESHTSFHVLIAHRFLAFCVRPFVSHHFRFES